jgi:hypothetical protein
VQDRPVLGGNASSELRMWICGAHGENNRETGIVEELELENFYRNPEANYNIWDSVIYEKVKAEDNITLLLNCTCIDCVTDGNRIVSARCWQTTNETRHIIYADLFADCSGDSVLAPLTGAEYRVGREASSEFGESIEPEEADKKTMGMSILFQARETGSPKKFIPPSFAYRYDDDSAFKFRSHDRGTNYWWIEVGGENDSIHDTEEMRDELIKISYGVWDHIKNRGDHGMDNWVLEWIGFLPGKRESRRYVGDHILTQNDVRAGGVFDDVAAYGGWTMDDHHPAGFYHPGEPNIFHPAPSPFGIPYRCLYSKNIENLYFAGRNISVTHAALSATRVMGTCSLLGQAVGTAAAIAIKKRLTPRQVYETEIAALKQTLMDDDCRLPRNKRDIPEITKRAVITVEAKRGGATAAAEAEAKKSAAEAETSVAGAEAKRGGAAAVAEAEALRNGYDRPENGNDNCMVFDMDESVIYNFNKVINISGFRIVFDSDLNRTTHNMPCVYPLDMEPLRVPETMVKEFTIAISGDGVNYTEIIHDTNNYQRLVKIGCRCTARYVKLTPLRTWGCEQARIFSWDIYNI